MMVDLILGLVQGQIGGIQPDRTTRVFLQKGSQVERSPYSVFWETVFVYRFVGIKAETPAPGFKAVTDPSALASKIATRNIAAQEKYSRSVLSF